MFLTVGIIIAVVGMRLVFPILIVAVTAGLGFSEVVKLALYDSKEYAHYLELAHPSIAAFGGGFLLTLALYFCLTTSVKSVGLPWLEKKLQAAGGHWWLAPTLALVGVGLAALLPGNKHVATTLEAGIIGVVGYTAMTQLMAWLGRKEPVDKDGKSAKVQTGWAAFGGFMYLQLLDASFSFDGVLGAFAITNDVILIAVGLGVGALWVWGSFTVQLVRYNTLEHLPYLEHGAHYAILALLALAPLASITFHIPDAVTGFVGIVIIIASLGASAPGGARVRLSGSGTVFKATYKLQRIDEGQGVPVVLLHGIGRSGAVWSALRQLLAMDYRVIAFDLLWLLATALNRSSCTTLTTTLPVIAAIKKLHQPVVLVGHSMGALVALRW